MEVRRGRHVVSALHAHLVFVTKFRRDVLSALAIRDLTAIFAKVCRDFEAELIECSGEDDQSTCSSPIRPRSACRSSSTASRAFDPQAARPAPRDHRPLPPGRALDALVLRRLVRRWPFIRRGRVCPFAAHRRALPGLKVKVSRISDDRALRRPRPLRQRRPRQNRRRRAPDLGGARWARRGWSTRFQPGIQHPHRRGRASVVQVDLGQRLPLSAIVVHNRRELAREAARSLRIEVSEDGAAWTLIHAGLTHFRARGQRVPCNSRSPPGLGSLRQGVPRRTTAAGIDPGGGLRRATGPRTDPPAGAHRPRCPAPRRGAERGRADELTPSSGLPGTRDAPLIGLFARAQPRPRQWSDATRDGDRPRPRLGLRYFKLAKRDISGVIARTEPVNLGGITFLPNTHPLPEGGWFLEDTFGSWSITRASPRTCSRHMRSARSSARSSTRCSICCPRPSSRTRG